MQNWKSFGCARLAISVLVLAALLAACVPAAPPPTPTPPPKAAPTPTAAPVAKPAPTPTVPPTPKPTPKPAKVSYPIMVMGTTFWPAFVMRDKGFAAEENLELELFLVPPAQAVAALLGKSVDIGTLDIEMLGRAVEGGEKLAGVGGISAQGLYTLMTPPAIKSFEQLRGKRLGVFVMEGSSTTILERMLAAKGLKKGDFELVLAGGTAERWAALKAGGVQGALLTQPFDVQAMAEGYNKLMISSEVIKDFQHNTVVVRTDWPKASPDNEDVLVRFLRALAKASRWLNDSKNKQEAVQILAKVAKMDEKLVSQIYDLYVEHKVFPREGEINMSGTKEVLNIMGELGVFKGAPVPPADKYVDMSYWEKAVGRR